MPAAPDEAPFSDDEIERLFAPLELYCGGATGTPGAIVAVSGGSDSLGLLHLLRRWREARRAAAKGEVPLVAVTVDHGLRAGAGAEARAVGELARGWDFEHVLRRWEGEKPATGVQEAARAARYALLGEEARRRGLVAILTAHTLDDQAETFLMRLARGSGLHGLTGMTFAATRDDVQIVRPLLEVPRARLRAELEHAGVAWLDDPSNQDPRYLRPRLRPIMRLLAEEGLDARRIADVVAKLRRADAALEWHVRRFIERQARIEEEGPGPDGGPVTRRLEPHWFTSHAVDFAAERALPPNATRSVVLPLEPFEDLPPEIAHRLIARAIAIVVPSVYPPEDAQLAQLVWDIGRAQAREERLRRTLAGALISLESGAIRITPEPARRLRRCT